MAKPANSSGSEIKQVGRFGLVGVANTLVDFVSFNIFRLFIPVTIASALSGTIAMIGSYFMNQRYTFKRRRTEAGKVALFFALTAFGLYVIRPLVITLFTKHWLWPANLAYDITTRLGLGFSQQFITDNLALVAAIAVVLFYNYITYKKLVFNENR